MPEGAITFTQVEMVIGVIFAILAVVGTSWQGVKAIKEAISPLTSLVQQGEEHTRKIGELEADARAAKEALELHQKYLDRDKKELEKDRDRLDDLEKSNRLVLRGISQLIEHELSGNHTEELRKTRNDIDEYLINR